MSISKSSSRGREGEALVQELLPGCNWINKDSETWENYDIEWDGIYINVKTSRSLHTKGYPFTLIPQTGAGVMFVMVGMPRKLTDKPKFWITMMDEDVSYFYGTDKNKIEEIDLPMAIKKLASNSKKKYKPGDRRVGETEDFTRFSCFVLLEDYKKLKSVLAAEGTTLSTWIRKLIKEKIK